MIWIYGRNTIEYSSKRPKDIVCHQCHHTGQTFVKKLLTYWHIWYIPIFPYRIWTQYDCVRCNFSGIQKELSPLIKNEYEKFNTRKTLPVWTFSGLIIIFIILMVFLFKGLKSKWQMISELDNIEINHKFDYKTENGNYSIFQVTEVDGPNIKIVYNTLETSSKKGTIEIDKSKYYSTDTITTSKNQLRAWVNDGTIVFIYRYH